MSTFKIYSANDNNAENLGVRNTLNFRLIVILLPIIGFVIEMISKIFHNQFPTIFWIIYLSLIILVIGYSLILINNLKQIGTISFSESGLIKKIGDFSETREYDSILRITLKIHIRDMFFQKNKFGIRTYYLEMQSKENGYLRLVVSAASIDTPGYGLGDMLTTLSKTKQIELIKL
jgi:hypothetical protein